MDLNELAAKVEALSGPDREVDALITIELDWASPIYGSVKAFLSSNSASDIGKYLVDLPAYTASIDAAMTLVPDGWNWGVWRRHDWAKQNAQVWHPQQESWTKHGDAATPALAIVAAALRARSQATSQ